MSQGAGPPGIMHRIQTYRQGPDEQEETTAYHLSDLSHLLGNLSVDPDLKSPDASAHGSKDWFWAVSSPRSKQVSRTELTLYRKAEG